MLDALLDVLEAMVDIDRDILSSTLLEIQRISLEAKASDEAPFNDAAVIHGDVWMWITFQ